MTPFSTPFSPGDHVDYSPFNLLREDVLFNLGQYVASTGSANAYVVAIDDNDNGEVAENDGKITALTEGHFFKFKANFANTGAATLTVKNVAGDTIQAAANLKDSEGNALAEGAIVSGQLVFAWWTGTEFRMINVSLLKASQAEAEAGVENTKFMTALRVKEAIEALQNISDEDASTLTDNEDASALHFHKITIGNFQKDTADASTTLQIAHGLGVAPKLIKFYWIIDNSSFGCFGEWTAAAQQAAEYRSALNFVTDAAVRLGTNSAYQKGVVGNVDADSFDIVFTKTGSPSFVYRVFWEAYA